MFNIRKIMHKHILLSILLLSMHHCFAMETEQQIKNFTTINNGLLTEIEAKITQTDYVGFLAFNRSITGTTVNKDTLINLIHYKKVLDNKKGANAYELFCPIVLKESNGCIIDLGQFNPYKHKEAKEAIRHNKALYYNGNQGAIIYSITE